MSSKAKEAGFSLLLFTLSSTVSINGDKIIRGGLKRDLKTDGNLLLQGFLPD